MTPDITDAAINAALGNFLTAILPSACKIVKAQVNRVPEPVDTDFVLMNTIMRTRFATNQDMSEDVAFTGSIAATVLTVSAIQYGTIQTGRTLFGIGIADNTIIGAQLSGTPGGVGTYSVSPSQTVASETMAAGAITHQTNTEVVLQLDVHGPNSGDNAQTIFTLFRDGYAVEWFEDYAASNLGVSLSPLYAGEPQNIPQTPFINAEQQYETRWIVKAHLQANITLTTPQEFAAELTVGIDNVDVLYSA